MPAAVAASAKKFPKPAATNGFPNEVSRKAGAMSGVCAMTARSSGVIGTSAVVPVFCRE